MGERQAAGLGERQSSAHAQLLGAIRYVRADGRSIDLPSPSQRRLFAVLAVHRGTTLRGPQLCDLLGIQTGALRATVSRVRRLIGADVVYTDAVGYRLDIPTDIAIFGDLVSGALTAPDVDGFDAALAMWRGPAIDEFADEAWAEATVAHADELRCIAIEGRAAELVRIGRSDEAAAELGMHVADRPLRDRAQGLLMLALSAQGRQAEALRSFQVYRNLLAEEIGTVPSPGVRALERWVLDPSGHELDEMWPTPLVRSVGRPPVVARSDDAAIVVPPPRSGDNVPVFRSSFVGRDIELRQLLGDVGGGRGVTLVGEGGVGKTRLAARAAEELAAFGRAVWFVELAAVNEADAVVGAIAAQVGSPLVNGLDGLEQYIGDRDAVIVLDNCEHLVDVVADLVDGLLSCCAGLAIIATSREPLCVEGERVHRVPPLDPRGDAAELFHARAEAAARCSVPTNATRSRPSVSASTATLSRSNSPRRASRRWVCAPSSTASTTDSRCSRAVGDMVPIGTARSMPSSNGRIDSSRRTIGRCSEPWGCSPEASNSTLPIMSWRRSASRLGPVLSSVVTLVNRNMVVGRARADQHQIPAPRHPAGVRPRTARRGGRPRRRVGRAGGLDRIDHRRAARRVDDQ